MFDNIKIVEITTEDPLYLKVLNLRQKVLRIPIGMDLFKEDLSMEPTYTFFVAVAVGEEKGETDTANAQGDKVVGCLALVPFGDDATTYKLKQMAVDPEYQGKKLGLKLVQGAEEFSKRQGKNRIYLHGRKYAVNFYLKSGFQFVGEGNEFLESGIPHFALEKILV